MLLWLPLGTEFWSLSHHAIDSGPPTEPLSPSPQDHADGATLAPRMRRDPLEIRAKQQKNPLPKWRLKRVADYIEAHLDKAITLADLARAAGLTPMHFAAQFRAATGRRPHEYLLRCRIALAMELLADSNERLVDVALSTGFQTQAHFTTVFKRFAGTTPHRWRHEARKRLPQNDLCRGERVSTMSRQLGRDHAVTFTR
ncbi:MAG: helix-turn-helix domain-containing protein [Methylovirgula sp.]